LNLKTGVLFLALLSASRSFHLPQAAGQGEGLLYPKAFMWL